MNDIIIFTMGCLVSLVVVSAVVLLMWGAANEPNGSVAATDVPSRSGAPAQLPRSEPTPDPPSGLGSRSPA